MRLHQKINIRGHLYRYGVLILADLTVKRAEFMAYRCTGRSVKELAVSPYLTQRPRPGTLRRMWANRSAS